MSSHSQEIEDGLRQLGCQQGEINFCVLKLKRRPQAVGPFSQLLEKTLDLKNEHNILVLNCQACKKIIDGVLRDELVPALELAKAITGFRNSLKLLVTNVSEARQLLRQDQAFFEQDVRPLVLDCDVFMAEAISTHLSFRGDVKDLVLKATSQGIEEPWPYVQLLLKTPIYGCRYVQELWYYIERLFEAEDPEVAFASVQRYLREKHLPQKIFCLGYFDADDASDSVTVETNDEVEKVSTPTLKTETLNGYSKPILSVTKIQKQLDVRRESAKVKEPKKIGGTDWQFK